MMSVRMDANTFNGTMDPKLFTDWISDIDRYFSQYETSEPRKVKLAKMKLVGATRLSWTNLECNEEAFGLPAGVTWEIMK